MPSIKYEGLGYPIHFLKRRGSIIRDNFLKCRTKKVTLFARQSDFMNCSLQIKQNIYLKGTY